MTSPNRSFKFSDAALGRLPPQPAEAAANAAEYSDEGCPGLKLEVSKSGAKTFLCRYTLRGRRGYLRLGSYPALSLKEARARAQEVRAAVDRGEDPAAARLRRKAMPTLDEFVAEEYLPHARGAGKRSVKDDESKLRLHILPRLGARRLDEIERRELMQYHAAVRESHCPATANRHLALLKAIYGHAVELGVVERSPAQGLSAFREDNARTRYLSEPEVQRLHAALDAEPNQVAAAVLRLLLLTGARLDEVRALPWAELDLEGGLWHLPAQRTKSRKPETKVLSAEAVALLRAQPRAAGAPFVFPGFKDARRPVNNIQKPFKRVLAAAGLADATIHSLRHTHISHLLMNGVPMTVVSELVGHHSLHMTKRYAHMASSALRAAAGVASRTLGRQPVGAEPGEEGKAA